MSEFSRWLSRRNPQYFVEQQGGLMPPMQQNPTAPPMPAANSYEANVKNRLERKQKIEQMRKDSTHGYGKANLDNNNNEIKNNNNVPRRGHDGHFLSSRGMGGWVGCKN